VYYIEKDNLFLYHQVSFLSLLFFVKMCLANLSVLYCISQSCLTTNMSPSIIPPRQAPKAADFSAFPFLNQCHCCQAEHHCIVVVLPTRTPNVGGFCAPTWFSHLHTMSAGGVCMLSAVPLRSVLFRSCITP